MRYFLKQIMKYVSEASPNSSENFKIHTELNIKYLFDILEQCRPVGQQRMKSVSTSTEDPSKIHLSFKGNRYSSKEIRGSATIMYSSYKTFKFLRENSIVPLPSRRTVQRRTEKFRFGPKRNEEFLSLLKTKIEESDTSALVSSLTRDMSGLSASPASIGRLDGSLCLSSQSRGCPVLASKIRYHNPCSRCQQPR